MAFLYSPVPVSSVMQLKFEWNSRSVEVFRILCTYCFHISVHAAAQRGLWCF